MNLIPAKTPRLLKGLYPNFTWDIPNDQNAVYLTFDDGPTPEITEWTLNLLSSYNAKATFFCVGENIEKYPDIFKAILSHGHVIGNHTYNHPGGWKTKTATYVEQVIKTQKLIEEHGSDFTDKSKTPKLFRPPYGKISRKQGRQLIGLGYKIIMWDVLAFDWKDSISKEKSAKNVISNAQSGSIIVFHDSFKAAERMQYALPKTLEFFSKKGFVFKSILSP